MLQDELSLRDYVAILRARWWLVALAIAVAAGLGLIWSLLQTPQYRSTVRVLVDADSAAEIFDPVTGQARGARAMTNESEFAKSFQVTTAAKERLADQGFADVADSATVQASESANSDVIEITAVALSGNHAALAAQTHALTYIDLRREQVVEEYLATAEVIERRFGEVQEELESLPAGASARRAILESQLSAFGQALSDLGVSAELGGSGAQIIGPAQVPTAPFAPQTGRNLVLGLVLGLIAGVGAAVLLDAIDNSIQNKADVEVASGGVPNLAIVPTVRDWRERATTRIVTVERPQSHESEAYRTLRAALDFVTVDTDAKILQITSANPGEGKTTTAVNLAVTLARNGRRVILVDGDLRKPRIHAFFDVPVEPGFTSLILGQSDANQVGHEVERDAGVLTILASGPLPPGPSELLGSARTGHVLDELAMNCDVLIIDSAPVLPVSDALVLAKKVDATILVANGARTTAPELAQAVELLRQVDARLIGTVLNQVNRRRGGYGYGYGYGYDQDTSGTGSVPNEVRGIRRNRNG